MGYRNPATYPRVIPEDNDAIMIIRNEEINLAEFKDIGDGDLRIEIKNARQGEATLVDNLNKIKDLITVLQNNYTKEQIDQKFKDITGGAPDLLDTLNELATALGDDPNFATTILNLLKNKVDKVDGEMLISSTDWDSFKKDIEAVKNTLSSMNKNITIDNTLYPTTNIDNNYSVTVPNLTALTDGYPLKIKFNIASTGVITVNPSTLGAKAVVDYFGNPVTNVRKDLIANLVYDATNGNFQLLGKGGGGDLVAADLLYGKKATGNDGPVVGTMTNNVAVTATLVSNNQEYTIPAGFHNGLGKIKALITNLAAAVIKAGTTVGGIVGTFTSDATATAAQMLSGAKAYVNGVLVTGTIPSKAAATITPSTVNQTIAAEQYISGIQTILGDAGLISGNIKATKSIFNINGKASVVDTEDATAIASDIASGKTAYVNGNKVNGNATGKQYTELTFNHINGVINSVTFPFAPSIVVVTQSDGANSYIVRQSPIATILSYGSLSYTGTMTLSGNTLTVISSIYTVTCFCKAWA